MVTILVTAIVKQLKVFVYQSYIIPEAQLLLDIYYKDMKKVTVQFY
jgi:hypothetical protein